MCLTTEIAVRNLTVRVTLLAMRWVHFWADSATSPPRIYSFWRYKTQIRMNSPLKTGGKKLRTITSASNKTKLQMKQ